MRFAVLGPIEVGDDDGEMAPVGSAKQRAVLAMLLSHDGATIAVDEIVDGLWGDRPPPTAQKTLRSYMSRLRRLVGDRLVRSDGGYRLECGGDDLDARSFENDVAGGRHTEALARVRGRPYDDMADLAVVRPEARRLDSLIATARVGQIEDWLGDGRLADAIAGAEAMVVENPLDERIWAVLVRALGRSGRVADALRAFRRASTELSEAGLVPGSDLRRAEQEALDGPPAASDRRRTPPEPLTRSIGRDDDIAHVSDLVSRHRLTTVVGPGGVGKTRTAIEVGRRLADSHRLGARVVELARLSEPSAVRPAIARALDLDERESELDDGYGAVDALLILDNAEHVIDTLATEIPGILSGGRELRVLVTSREPLSIPGEHRWALSPLDASGVTSPALTLFIERARDVGVTVDPTDERARIVISRIDGLPLAIEMAAARLATMGLADLEEHMNVVALGDPARSGQRHGTLRSLLAWSEELLTPELRTTLADFSVFAGAVEPADLPAVLSSPDPVGAVTALAARSLVVAREVGDGRTRYEALEVVRRFGRERLAQAGRNEAVSRRHAEWFTCAAEDAANRYDGPAEAEASARFEAILDELRDAHRWSRVHDRELALRMSHALHLWAYQNVRLEVVDWGEALAATLDSTHPGRPRLLGEVASGMVLAGRFDEARHRADEAIATATNAAETRAAHATLSDLELYIGDLEGSLHHARIHWQLAQSATAIERGFGMANLTVPLAYQGRVEEALQLLNADSSADAGPSARGWLAYSRGEVLLDADPEAALRDLETAVALAESVDNHFLGEVARVSAATLRSRTGRPNEAVRPLARTIERLADRGNLTHLLTTLRNVPTILVSLDQWIPTAELLGALSVATISPTFGEEAARLETAEADAREVLGTKSFEDAWNDGARSSLIASARRMVAVLDGLAVADLGERAN